MIGTLVAYHARWLAGARDVLATVLLTGGVVALAALLTLHDAGQSATAAATVLWLVATVGGLLASARVLAAEHGSGGLQGLMLAPIERRDVFLARAVSTSGLVLVLSAITWIVVLATFPSLPGLLSIELVLVALAAAAGLGPLGALAGWAALSTRAGELVGPVLAVPTSAPLVVAGFHATERLLLAANGWEASLTFAAGYALAVGALTYLVSDHVVEVA